MIMVIQKPEWLESLYTEKFFVGCSYHESAKKNEKNICCLDCCISICPHCIPFHRFHRLLQVRRYVYHDVVRLEDLQKVIDCSNVQAYTINRAKAVFITKRRQHRQLKGSGNYCTSCDRCLQEPYIHCSLGCKVDFVLEHYNDLSPFLRKCKTLQLSPDFLIPQEFIEEETSNTTSVDCEEAMVSSPPRSSENTGNNYMTCSSRIVRKKRSEVYACARSAHYKISHEDMVTTINRRKRIPHRSPLC